MNDRNAFVMSYQIILIENFDLHYAPLSDEAIVEWRTSVASDRA